MKRALIAMMLAAGLPAQAENMTTAAEVKPIVEMIKAQWVAVRTWEGNDLLYFTTLLSWRCGLDQIAYAVNDAEPVVYEGEPCYDAEAAPNALKMEGVLPYVTLPGESVETVDVFLTFDDETTAQATYERAQIQIQ